MRQDARPCGRVRRAAARPRISAIQWVRVSVRGPRWPGAGPGRWFRPDRRRWDSFPRTARAGCPPVSAAHSRSSGGGDGAFGAAARQQRDGPEPVGCRARRGNRRPAPSTLAVVRVVWSRAVNRAAKRFMRRPPGLGWCRVVQFSPSILGGDDLGVIALFVQPAAEDRGVAVGDEDAGRAGLADRGVQAGPVGMVRHHEAPVGGAAAAHPAQAPSSRRRRRSRPARNGASRACRGPRAARGPGRRDGP